MDKQVTEELLELVKVLNKGAQVIQEVAPEVARQVISYGLWGAKASMVIGAVCIALIIVAGVVLREFEDTCAPLLIGFLLSIFPFMFFLNGLFTYIKITKAPALYIVSVLAN